MRRILRFGFWLAGLLATAAWTWLLVVETSLAPPAAYALGLVGLVLTLWGDAVFFPSARPEGTPAAPGRMPREQAIEESGNWAKERSATPAPRPVDRPRPATPRPAGTRPKGDGTTPPPGATPRWANTSATLARPD